MGIQYWLSTENQVAWHTVGNELVVECETVNHLAPLYEYRRRQRVNYVCVHPSAYAALRSFAALRACVWVPPDIISLVQYTVLVLLMFSSDCLDVAGPLRSASEDWLVFMRPSTPTAWLMADCNWTPPTLSGQQTLSIFHQRVPCLLVSACGATLRAIRCAEMRKIEITAVQLSACVHYSTA